MKTSWYVTLNDFKQVLHADTLPSAALEVYVCRAYRAYSLLPVDYDEGDDVDDADPL